jgi:hypothetical protein
MQESDEAVFVAGLAFDRANDDPWLLQMCSSFTPKEQQGNRTRYGFFRVMIQMEINRFS